MFARLMIYVYWTMAVLAASVMVLAASPAIAKAQGMAPTKDARGTERVVVRPGDSLWSISGERLGPNATPRQIASDIERIHALNRKQIGYDPDLLFPGQKLLLPPVGKLSTAEPPTGVTPAREAAEPARTGPMGRGAERGTDPTSSTVLGEAGSKGGQALDPTDEPTALPDMPPEQGTPEAGSLSATDAPSPVESFGRTERSLLSSATSTLGGVFGQDELFGRRLLGLGIIALTLGVAILMAWRLPMERDVGNNRAWCMPKGAPPRNHTTFSVSSGDRAVTLGYEQGTAVAGSEASGPKHDRVVGPDAIARARRQRLRRMRASNAVNRPPKGRMRNTRTPQARHFLWLTYPLATLLAVLSLMVWAPPASAAPSSVPDAGTAHTDGRVWAVLRLGDRVYLGGDFTNVNGVARNRLAAINATTGKLTSWNPNANGSVRTLAASPDGTRLYAGGDFTSVGGTYRGRLAALDAATGRPDSTWKPGTANATVRSIAVSGSRVYIGGSFTTLKGQSRKRLALVDGATGALDPSWLPATNASVWALALSPIGERLYVGGDFSAVSGRSSPHLVALAASNTGATVWQPGTRPNGTIYDIEARGTSVYSAEGGPGGAAAAYNVVSGARAWRASADGDVQALAYLDGKVYLGGHFTGFAAQDRRFLAAVDAGTGRVGSWNPGGSGGLGVWELESDPLITRIYAGGDFTSVSGMKHKRFAQFSD